MKIFGISTHTELAVVLLSMRRVFFSAAVFSFFINVLMLTPSIYMLQVYDRVLASRNETTLLMITLIVLAMYVLIGGLEWIRSSLMVRASLLFDNALKSRVFSATFESILRKAGGNPGQYLTDLTNVRQFFTGSSLFAFFDAPWAPIFLVVIYLLHPLLALVAVFGALLLVALTYLTEKITSKPLSEANQAASHANLYANNSLRNAEVIEAMGMLPRLRERWYGKQNEMLTLQQVASDRAGRIGSISRFVRITQQSLILGVGAWLVIQDELTPGAMIAASILMGRALAPVELAIASWKGLISARSSYERLEKLLAMFPVRPETMPLPAPQGNLAIENISVLVPGTQTLILRNVSFSVAAGEVLAVIGPSASGKSTLARLLVGVWTAAAGKVRLDGADIFSWDKTVLGSYLGYLPQDIELFEGNIAENIARFGEIDSDEVVRAAKRAGVHEMILRLPQGYETPIGEAGGFLSGGQRQRVGLARAMYRDPVLVVLDEPNSNLDEQGEIALVRAVQELKSAGCTVIIVTHRTNIIGVVDKMLLMRDGAVQLFGPTAEVLATMRGPVASPAQNTATLNPAKAG